MWKLTTAYDQGLAVKLSGDITSVDINALYAAFDLKLQAHKIPACKSKSSSRFTFDF